MKNNIQKYFYFNITKHDYVKCIVFNVALPKIHMRKRACLQATTFSLFPYILHKHHTIFSGESRIFPVITRLPLRIYIRIIHMQLYGDFRMKIHNRSNTNCKFYLVTFLSLIYFLFCTSGL